MVQSVLIVRLGALGDLVHALPAAAALRDAWPEARIDWLVDRRYRALLEFVPIIDRRVVVGGSDVSLVSVVRALRREHYDLAIDLQGLMKSAALARFSAANAVLGFETSQLRERAAQCFYTQQASRSADPHVIAKNVNILRAVGVVAKTWRFPLAVPPSPIVDVVRRAMGLSAGQRFAIVNPGAGWPNKQWPPDRFGRVARHVSATQGWPTVVLWGPGEQPLAEAVVAASEGAAYLAPPTTLGDALAVIHAAALFVSGDTGPLQLAAALGTPIVGVFGPTDPARNGPWSPVDVTLSRFDQCECHHKRRCRRPTPCVHDIDAAAVTTAVDRRCNQVTFRD
jgi:lipopolysaccharide heptosyltransferase I